MENDYFQNPYPSNFTEQNNTNTQNQNSLVYKILPLILSGKNLTDILPSLANGNPFISAILSNLNNKQDTVKKQNTNNITGKIDMNGYIKIN